jgi:transcriptional regulator with XRE-family HTH domain
MNLQKLMAGLKRKRMTQAQLAERLGLSPSAVSRWKHGENATDEATLRKIEELLDLPAQDLSSPPASVEDRLREQSPPDHLSRAIPADAEAILTLHWHGMTRQIALSRDLLRQGQNVLQALADLDLLNQEMLRRAAEDASLGVTPE